ncbi:hypothetical protein METP1_01975 [Methanosarcinales archaeon]|nr:hypothetical protein METP1_01975 [Methanosarcinales archaeon]
MNIIMNKKEAVKHFLSLKWITDFLSKFFDELCRCRICQSYIECKEEIAFCLSTTGTSKCIKEEKGCLCPGCPVQEKMGFKHVYYCIRANVKDQSAIYLKRKRGRNPTILKRQARLKTIVSLILP